jgi:hypothetical protein
LIIAAVRTWNPTRNNIFRAWASSLMQASQAGQCSSNSIYLYSRGPLFDSRPRLRRFVVVFLGLSNLLKVYYIKIRDPDSRYLSTFTAIFPVYSTPHTDNT